MVFILVENEPGAASITKQKYELAYLYESREECISYPLKLSGEQIVFLFELVLKLKIFGHHIFNLLRRCDV